MNRKDGSVLYFILGIYSILISWYYNHSILLLIIHYVFWPVYLVYEILVGNLAHDMWRIIPASYFQ